MGSFATLLVALLTLRAQEERSKAELLFQRMKFEEELRAQKVRLETEFATEESAEAAIRHLLELHHLPYRSFPMIRHHIGGFEANELRRLLVRAGAVRFMAADGTELWALRDRVAQDYQKSRWKHPKAPMNKVQDSDLFPSAFNDSEQY
ncbi:MAG: hypothetical protein AAF329_12870 [Cyanobacteria bacterium P01_A01_bin.17]